MSLNQRLQDCLKTVSLEQPLGLYIHVPFCRDRCTYCTFTSCNDISLEPNYLNRLLQNMVDWSRFFGKPAVDTIYMGGGTPSILSLQSLQHISQTIHCEFDTANLLEATLEANPGTISSEWLVAARRSGWNRISLGIQTLDNTQLQCLGRIHNAAQGLAAIEMCKDSGFDRISADLMLGLPGQHLNQVLDDANCLIESGVEHLSIYLLDIDKQCLLKSRVDTGLLELPADDLVAETYQAIQEYLPQKGFTPYEISNYSRNGCQSIHNIRYWQRRPYIGFGPSAASNISELRWAENTNIMEWVNGVDEGEMQLLTTEELLAEIPLLALRMHDGVNWRVLRELAEAKGLSALLQNWEKEFNPFLNSGLLKWNGENLCLTPQGMLLSNQIFQIFV